MNKLLEKFDTRLVDALVDGEVSERERADLLRRCEQTPEGWRLLAHAFLEAQTWRQALESLDEKPTAAPKSLPMPTRRAHSRTRTFAWIGAWSASALLAFSLGLLGAGLRDELRQKDVVATRPVSPPATVAHSNNPASIEGQAPVGQALTPEVRLQLERLGYRIQERPRVVSVKRSDGQTVQVLVNEVELRYVGRPFSL
jgi:anti-sigma factor RsiW